VKIGLLVATLFLNFMIGSLNGKPTAATFASDEDFGKNTPKVDQFNSNPVSADAQNSTTAVAPNTTKASTTQAPTTKVTTQPPTTQPTTTQPPTTQPPTTQPSTTKPQTTEPPTTQPPTTQPPTTTALTTQTPTTHAPTTKPQTTVAPTDPQTTALPTTKPTDAPGSFDMPSFIGGIILCAGVVAIAFFGCKFYKNRSERNYHTL